MSVFLVNDLHHVEPTEVETSSPSILVHRQVGAKEGFKPGPLPFDMGADFVGTEIERSGFSCQCR